ncbi:MAG: ATP-binding protein [Propionibacteriaceae bacterium]|jgi:hypothetical protein|nr:ATP-binding protein [Propionibacteriaceae bacterium]
MSQTLSFLPAFGNRPPRLVGRDEEVAAFVRGLGGPTGHPDRTTLFIGQRGMGKTAMLLELADRGERAGFVPARATATEALLSNLLEAIQVNGARHTATRKKLKGVSLGALGFSVGLTFDDETEKKYGFRTKLGLLCDELARHDKGVLLLVDEVWADSAELRQLATAYQELVGEGKNIAIALAGLPNSVSAVLNDQVLTFLNRATKVQLGPIPVSDVAVHYFQTFSDLGKRIAAAEVERAAEATRGYPYLLQLVGYYLLEAVGDAADVGQEAVTLAIRSARRALIDSTFAPSLRPLTRGDLNFLSALAQEPEPALVRAAQERLGLSSGSAQQHRARLIGWGLVAPVRRGELEFVLPYLRDYLRQEL